MYEILYLTFVIAGAAWLLDRGRAAYGNRPRPGKQQPDLDKPSKPQDPHRSATLRDDWLRLGQRRK